MFLFLCPQYLSTEPFFCHAHKVDKKIKKGGQEAESGGQEKHLIKSIEIRFAPDLEINKNLGC